MISAKSEPGLGTILVDATGKTLCQFLSAVGPGGAWVLRFNTAREQSRHGCHRFVTGLPSVVEKRDWWLRISTTHGGRVTPW